MSDFFYVVKIAIVTLFFILLMQVHIGGVTLESHALNFVKTSELTAPIREVSEHGVVAVKTAYNKTVHFLDTKLFKKHFSSKTAGERSLFSFKRSDVIISKEEKKKEEKLRRDSEDKAEASY